MDVQLAEKQSVLLGADTHETTVLPRGGPEEKVPVALAKLIRHRGYALEPLHHVRHLFIAEDRGVMLGPYLLRQPAQGFDICGANRYDAHFASHGIIYLSLLFPLTAGRSD